MGNTPSHQGGAVDIRALQQTLAQQGTTIRALQQTLAQQGTTIHNLQQTLAQQGTTIQGLEQTVDQQVVTIQGLEQTVDRQVVTIQGLEQTVDRQGTTIQGLEQTVDRQAAMNTQLVQQGLACDAQLAHAHDALRTLQDRYDAIPHNVQQWLTERKMLTCNGGVSCKCAASMH